MHCHTFFSFNAYGHSPSSLAWLAKRRGFKAIGIVDFDVLDAVEEFLTACDLVGVRGSAGLETRVFVPEFATREINSPGEPGIAYHMGIGFTVSPLRRERGSHPARECETARLSAIARSSHASTPISIQCSIDYDRDVLPLTPAGNATERHVLVAYVQRGRTDGARSGRVLGREAGPACRTGAAPDRRCAQIPKPDSPQADEARWRGLRAAQSRLAFRPSKRSIAFTIACGALPCYAWLDGTLAGEQSIEELLELLISKGVVALNIVPDRNWNIADPDARRLKVRKLYEIVQLADRLALPLNIGTEMNAFGQRLVDDFDAPELARCVRPSWMGRISSTGTLCCSAPWGWAIKASGRKPTCPFDASATGSMRMSDALFCQVSRAWINSIVVILPWRLSRFWQGVAHEMDGTLVPSEIDGAILAMSPSAEALFALTSSGGLQRIRIDSRHGVSPRDGA